MQYLLDTGILLRLVNREAAAHDQIRQAVRQLKIEKHVVVMAFKNVSEFWNVCTRPVEARGGFGLIHDETLRRLRTIERIAALLPDSPDTYPRWRKLILDHMVKGVQVHDARLVALMEVHDVTHLLTLNPGDFGRYTHITTTTPEQITGGNVTSP